MPPANVDVGGSVEALALGASHTCALLDTNRVRCWGYGGMGRLGYGNTNDIGDGDEMPPANVSIGVPADTVETIASGGHHSCAIIGPSMGVRCWGSGSSGQLGYASTSNIGDGPAEMPPSMVNLGADSRVVDLAIGASHTCALLDTGAVPCWGAGSAGQLGYAATNNIGDDGNPAMPPADVDVGGTVEAIAAGANHTCALLDTGRVRCWGAGAAGQLGYGNAEDVGDDETPASAGDVPVF
jgi:alpha-tubulin suppressor-like RCC1 family protein